MPDSASICRTRLDAILRPEKRTFFDTAFGIATIGGLWVVRIARATRLPAYVQECERRAKRIAPGRLKRTAPEVVVGL